MALDFPTSPTNGQTYNGYVYSTSVGAWQNKPNAQSPFYTSDTPPSNPVTGDSWFNTNDGTMYIYTYDGNTYQWVEHRSQIAKSQVGLVPIMPTAVSVITGTASVAVDGTVSITGVGAVYLQGVFTSAYRNYHVVIDVQKNTSGANYLGLQLANGATESSTGYHVGSLASNVNATGLTQNGTYNGGYCVLGQMYYDTGRNYASMDIYRPALAEETGFTGLSKGDSAAIPLQNWIGGNHGVQTAYDALKVLVTANTMTGKIKVYGWN